MQRSPEGLEMNRKCILDLVQQAETQRGKTYENNSESNL